MYYYNPNQNPNNQYDNSYAQQYFAQQQMIAYYKNKRSKEIGSLIGTGVLLGSAIILYLVIQTVIVVALQRSEYMALYDTSATFQNCFNIVAVHLSSMLIAFGLLAFIKRKDLTGPLVPVKKVGAAKICAWTAFGLGCCLAANFAVYGLMQAVEKLGYKLTQPEMLKTDSTLAALTLILSAAIVPGIFEEFSFRCCALGVLKRYGKGFAVVAVSVVFGLIHGNVIQFVFAFLVGLICGYATVRTDNIIPAMLIHGLNNGLSVTQDICTYALGSKVSDYVTVALYVICLVLGIAGLVYLAIKKELVSGEPKKAKEPYSLSFGGKLLCLLPGLVIPFSILIWLTTSYIEKI